jgi:hypothetical protein
MRSKILISSLMALAISALTASACNITIRIACPDDKTAAGIEVCVAGVGCVKTDNLGVAQIDVPVSPETYTISVTPSTLPAGATLNPLHQKVKVDGPTAYVEFVLGGDFCAQPPPPGPCWLTGGGTIGKTKGTPDYSFGGVVYPGCSPEAAEGGNWNVIDHATGLHFQGKTIIVDACLGVPTQSPKVNVNIIDFHGFGILTGIAGNPAAMIPVVFVARATDNHDGGAGSDTLYLAVSDGTSTVLQIGASATSPAVISTGNLQIHTSSCDK